MISLIVCQIVLLSVLGIDQGPLQQLGRFSFFIVIYHHGLINTAFPEDNTDPENIAQSRYCDIDELKTTKIPNKDKSLALFHINACSLNKNVNELEHLLSCTNKYFDVIDVSETRITKNISLTNNFQTRNKQEFTATESSASDTLLYIANLLSYKPQLDLNICKSN